MLLKEGILIGALCFSMVFTTAAMPLPKQEPKLQKINELTEYIQKVQTDISSHFEEIQVKAVDTKKMSFTQREIEMITAVVMQEGGYVSRGTKVALTNVILNRLKDGNFGSSVYEVLHAPGQFGAIHNYYNRTLPPDAACKEAVMSALRGEDNSHGALYYCNPQFVYSPSAIRWFNNLTLVFELDGQKFYR